MKFNLYIFVLALFTISCNSNDDLQINDQPTPNGSWSLVNVSGGLAGVDDDFEINLITWDFSHDDLKLTITNNNTAIVIYDGLPSGIYDYEILSTTDDDEYLVVHNFGVNYKIITLSTSQFILDEGVAADGFLLQLSR